jgi:hypothetical protein
MKTTVTGVTFKIPAVEDTRGGNLGFIQKGIFYHLNSSEYTSIFDVPSSAYRGGHSHIVQQEFL